jgi:hypothetical protein
MVQWHARFQYNTGASPQKRRSMNSLEGLRMARSIRDAEFDLIMLGLLGH